LFTHSGDERTLRVTHSGDERTLRVTHSGDERTLRVTHSGDERTIRVTHSGDERTIRVTHSGNERVTHSGYTMTFPCGSRQVTSLRHNIVKLKALKSSLILALLEKEGKKMITHSMGLL